MSIDLQFNDVQVTGEAMAEAALRFLTCRYADDFNYVEEIDGKKVGCVNCYGVLLLTAREVGLIGPEFDVNLPWSLFGETKSKVLWQIIKINFDEVAREEARAGDVLLFRWHDVDYREQAVHHVAMHVGMDGEDHLMMHALDAESGGQDRVFVQRVSVLDWNRIDGVWRYKGAR